ncbi:MAG TPA: SIMPL domain-containing protein [Candidatus Dormibacteraeota bacterium]|nr:SIMPL domain-containing protein [Candidatus Dormibacteraeota bacterium]
MNARIVAVTALLLVGSVTTAQAQLKLPLPSHVGITVAAAASITPLALVAELPIDHELTAAPSTAVGALQGAAAARALGRLLPSLGLSADALSNLVPVQVLHLHGKVVTATTAALRIPIAQLSRSIAALRRAGWESESVTRLEAADPDAVRTEALVAAERIAHARAEAIAVAAGRKLGALIAVKPILLDDVIGGEHFAIPSLPFAANKNATPPTPVDIQAAALFTYALQKQ